MINKIKNKFSKKKVKTTKEIFEEALASIKKEADELAKNNNGKCHDLYVLHDEIKKKLGYLL